MKPQSDIHQRAARTLWGWGGLEPPGLALSAPLIWVQEKARERAILVVIAPMSFPAVQLHVDFIAGIQVQYDAVAGVVVILVRVLGYGAGAHLRGEPQEWVDPCTSSE